MIERAGMSDEEMAGKARQILAALEEHVLGQRRAAEEVLTAFMAGGHVLLEGVPGIGKTVLARSVAAVLGLDMRRVQFTPDLMAADVTGTNIFDPGKGEFRLVRGPVFTELLMADEINRTPPKTQAALLEAMQESQVTIDGTTHPLSQSFFVVATQNPIEFEGTYPLPEAQADRFLLRAVMGLPRLEDELSLLKMGLESEMSRWTEARLPEVAISSDQALELRRASRRSHVSEELLSYVLALASAVRNDPAVELGPSPRGSLSLVEAARAHAWLEGRAFVIPEDLKRLTEACWGHRVLLTAEGELEGHTPASVLRTALREVPVPRTG